MDQFEFRDFSGEDAFRYIQLCMTAFHTHHTGSNSTEEMIRETIEGELKTARSGTPAGNQLVKKGLFVDGQIASALKIHAYVMNFDGQDCELGGIGGVLSNPEIRGKGYASALCTDALKDMYHRGQIFSYLGPFQSSFYQKLGYEHCLTKIKWTIPLDYLPKKTDLKIRHYENTPQEQQEIIRTYEAFGRKYNMADVRSESRWETFFEAHSSYDTACFSWLHGEPDQADGFLSYQYIEHPDSLSDIRVTNFYFTNGKSLLDMLAFLRGFSQIAKQAEIVLPADVDLTGILADFYGGYGRKGVKREVLPSGMHRVVDVRKVLENACYRGKGSVALQISDPQCPWNNGCFRVEFDGRCTKIEEGTNADIQMSINTFTAMILGCRSLENCVFTEQVQLYGNEENLQKVFYQKPAWTEAAC